MLDEEHQRLPQSENDHNAYNLGTIYNHNVVIAGLPTTGNCSAASVVAQMRGTYPRLRFGLLVGIGGGVPTRTDNGHIRLGHVVVSQPLGQHSGAVQYDRGKAETNEFVRTGFLAPPPMVLLNAARELQVSRSRVSVDPLISNLERIDTSKRGLRKFKRPGADQDYLYESDHIHPDKEKSCQQCGCDTSRRIHRDNEDMDDEDDTWLVVHRGTIASGEVVMRNGQQRDALARDHKVLCFEMEAAGALNDFPCLVIRGISDYSDSHKNDKWHGYAAATAAAYARELFQHMPVAEVKQCRIAESDVERLVQNTQNSADHDSDTRVKEWLKPSDASTDLANAIELRHADTGTWFLESDHYRWLKSTSGSRLWLQSFPGGGKTVLASTIVEDLMRNNRRGKAVVYFFFTSNDVSKQNLSHMLRSLIYQLAEQYGSARTKLINLFKCCGQGITQPRQGDLVDVFNQMVSELGELTVVLDALDECAEIYNLSLWITTASNQRCKFILTSRPDKEIEASLASWISSGHIISLEKHVIRDIEAYIHCRLSEERSPSCWRSMHNLISETLVGKAAGMWRWVDCQLDELSTCWDTPAVRRVLQKLPKDLFETYDRILQKIPDSRVPNAIKLLQLLTFSKRPLRLEEAIDAVATEPEMRLPFHAETRVSPPEAIIGYCSSLVKITDSRTIKPDGKMIQLAHFSVREYLLLGRKETPYCHFFEERVANAAITRLFLAYIWTSAETEKSPLPSFRPITKIERWGGSKYPLLDLAVGSWMDHAAVAGEEEEITFSWTRKFFTDSSFLQFWARLYSLDQSSNAEALYHASHFGLHRSVNYLLRIGADPNAQGGVYGNALQASSTSGNTHIVRLLLNHGAAANARGGYYGSALHAAVWNGHISTLRLLLTHGADIGALNHHGAEPALQVAAYRGHAAIVNALLAYGADVNERNIRKCSTRGVFFGAEYHYTALEAASYEGHIEVVKSLIDNKAEIDARGDFFFPRNKGYDHFHSGEGYEHGTPLQAASMKGHLAIVRTLVASHADVNVESGLNGYALHAALSEAHTAVSLFLIESGADIHARGGYHGTTLNAAVYGGDVEMVRLLIEKGVAIDVVNCIGESALVQACEAGNIQIVKMLLHNGAYVDLRGGEHGTALCAAVGRGSSGMVQMLLDKGADVNTRSGRHDSASQSSCAGSPLSHDLVRLLLDNGADINAEGGKYGTALRAAVVSGDGAVVQMLLRQGADINAHGQGTNCALCDALRLGRFNIVQIFLEHAAVARRSGNHISALGYTISPRCKEFARSSFRKYAGAELAQEDATQDPNTGLRKNKTSRRRRQRYRGL